MNLFDTNCMIGRRAAQSPEQALMTPGALLAVMDRYGIAEALVYHAMALDSHPADGNARLMREIAGQARLHACWVLLPETGEMQPAAELVRQMREQRVRAARMFPLEHKFAFSEVNVGGVLATLEEARMPLFVDFGVTHWSSTNTDWSAIDDVCARHPNLPVIVVGEGIGAPRRLFPMWERHPNLRLETSYYQVHQGLDEAARRFGPQCLLFGTGLPVRDPALPIVQLRHCLLGDNVREAIGAANARRLLGLPPATKTAPAPAWSDVAALGRPIIDAHAHLGRWSSSYVHAGDADGMVRTMDRMRIRSTAIVAFDAIGPDMRGGNDEIAAAMGAHPGRFLGYATVDPNLPGDEITAELRRCFDELHFHGIKFHCDMHACPADSDRYRPALEYADAHELAVLIHGQITAPMLRSYPHAQFLAAHTGSWDGRSPNAVIDLCGDYPNIYCELCSSVAYRDAMERLVERVGAGRIVHGSDTPLMDAGYQLGRVLGAAISAEEKRQILYSNAARLFHLPAA